VYRVTVLDEVVEQEAALPVSVLPEYGRVFAVIERAPWSGRPYDRDRPAMPMRWWAFGPDKAGVVLHVIVERERMVQVLQILWLGDD
jgi:hypothetical protein